MMESVLSRSIIALRSAARSGRAHRTKNPAPWRDPSSASEASPRSASRATRALNFDEWFLRERFMVATPLHWHYRRYGGAVHHLTQADSLSKKAGPPLTSLNGTIVTVT